MELWSVLCRAATFTRVVSTVLKQANLCAPINVRTTVFLIIGISLQLDGGLGAYAQGGPPLLTDDPGTPGDGRWEVNVALTIERFRTETLYETPLLDINYGLGERIQLKLEVPWLVKTEDGERTRNGLGNSAVGMKWRFFDEARHGVAMSVYPQFDFNNPTSSADRGIADDGTELLLPFELEKTVGPFGVNTELGYAFVQRGDDEWVYGLALGYEVSNQLELLAEVHGTAQHDFKGDELVFNLGTRWALSDTFTLLLAAGRSFRDSASGEPKFLLYTGLQVTI